MFIRFQASGGGVGGAKRRGGLLQILFYGRAVSLIFSLMALTDIDLVGSNLIHHY